jgi:nucleotide-binding universal stress UspA family protein
MTADGPGGPRFELGSDGPRAIVVGLDGSPTSLDAVAYAVGVARRQRSRLVVVFVRQRQAGFTALADRTGEGVASYTRAQDTVEVELRHLLHEHTEITGVAIDFVVRTGDPFTEIAAIATRMSADAVIVGASTGIGHRVAGSLAGRLVRDGRWPVTVVP